jgi:2-oxo-4-hydroxy-4-carboxy-5-ureidoimidazoline decarboxylase
MVQLDGLGLAAFNALAGDEAAAAGLACCSSSRWAKMVADGRPYSSTDEVYRTAESALAALADTEIDEALAGHPRIGERAANEHAAWSRREQAGIAGADDELRAVLADGNREYERRFGHVYLVCATGKSAAEMLAILQERLRHDAVTERRVVRAELGKINRIRLERMLADRT